MKGKANKEVSGGKQKGVIHMMETSKKAKRATEGSRQKKKEKKKKPLLADKQDMSQKTLKVLGRTVREEGRRKSKKIENNQV